MIGSIRSVSESILEQGSLDINEESLSDLLAPCRCDSELWIQTWRVAMKDSVRCLQLLGVDVDHKLLEPTQGSYQSILEPIASWKGHGQKKVNVVKSAYGLVHSLALMV